jgi:hypothetical protein
MDYRPLLEEFAEWLQDDVFTYCEKWNRPFPKWVEGLGYSQAFRKFKLWVQTCFANCHPEFPETLDVSGSITPRLKETFEGSEIEIAFWLGRNYEQHRRIRVIPLYTERELESMPREVLLQIKNSFPASLLDPTQFLDESILIQEITKCQKLLGPGESVLPRELNIGDLIVVEIRRIANKGDTVIACVQNVAIGPNPRMMEYWRPGNPVHSLFKIAILPTEEIQGNTRVKINSQIYIPEFEPQQRIFRLK